MCKLVKIVALSVALVGGVGFASALLAGESGNAADNGRPMMRPGMMGGGMMGGGMMNMKEGMSGMMEHCSEMMQGAGQGSDKPNQQWRKGAPAAPGDNR